MKLTIIAAIDEKYAIGLNGKMPWHIPEDLKRFRNLTINHPIIMGRKTFYSIPERLRPLDKRKNIVLSKKLKFEDEKGIYIARSIDEALELTKGKDSYVIGGEKVYESFLPFSDRMEITQIHKDYKGDTFFPHINWGEWDLLRETENRRSGRDRFSYLTYIRKNQ